MTLIVCVDDNNGLLFNKRRQSRDRALTARVLTLCEGEKLWVTPYSASLFADADITIDDEPLAHMAMDDAAFIEAAVPSFANASRLIVYRWNRRYPADTYLPVPEEYGFVKTASAEFAGHSHERITEDIYEKRGDSA